MQSILELFDTSYQTPGYNFFHHFSLQEHIQEVLNKWQSIDDEIWAKIIVLERNRRVAKAYARAPVLTVNGSDDGFDGFRIGLAGFENPMRDKQTEEVKLKISLEFYPAMVSFWADTEHTFSWMANDTFRFTPRFLYWVAVETLGKRDDF